LVVTPGFIDMMGGSTLPLLLDPVSAESKLRQGITTMMAGEGGSLAPQNERTREDLRQASEGGHTWSTFDEYFRLLEEEGVALNVIHNVGAAQVRRIIVGDEDRDPTPEQLDRMKELVAEAMEDGAIGLSTALIYPPGSYAKTEEIIELAKVAAQHGGVYFTHMRNESNQVLEAIAEAVRVSREGEIPTHIYHLKAAGQENWPLMAEALGMIEAARSEGLDVTADIYPYIRNGIGLGSFIHPRHYARGAEPFLATLGDAGVRGQLQREIETTSDWENWYRHVGRDWDNVLISRVGSDADPSFVGLSVKQVADRRGVDAWQAFFDLVEAGGVSVNPKSMNEEQKHEAMRASFVTFDNDASPTNPSAVASSHPRAFGAFPRILAKYVRDEKVISLEEAVRKLTSLPASILKLEQRGRISSGMAADIIMFDPQTIQDRATFTDPLLYSEGIDYVVVGGELVVDQGTATSARPGRVLRREG
jgi:N-acyl-D-aspartate/D-glutamate deacylase